MKGIRLHWSLHPDKAEGIYKDDAGQLRSPWYDNEITSKQMTPAAVARELDISYALSVEGIVFKEFQDAHILYKPYEVLPDLPVYRFVDYGRVNACTFAQLRPNGQLVFFKEIVLEGSNTDSQAQVIEAFSSTLGVERFIDYGDPTGEYGDVNKGISSVSYMHNHGIYPSSKAHKMAGPKRRDMRNDMMKQKLLERTPEGGECIQVHHKMTCSIDAFQSGYRYKEDANGNVLDTIHEVHPYEDVVDCIAGTVFEIFNPTRSRGDIIDRPERVRNPYTGY